MFRYKFGINIYKKLLKKLSQCFYEHFLEMHTCFSVQKFLINKLDRETCESSKVAE